MSGRRAIFCDHNAGAPVLPDVLELFVTTERDCPANPASSHAAGRRARAVLEQARERIASALGLAQATDVVFTSGGTEATNTAVRGLGDPKLPVLLGDVEHPAVREAAAARGIRSLAIDTDGRAILNAPTDPVGLLALTHAQSELGTLQPIPAALQLAADLGVPTLIDAAQTLGRVALDTVAASDAVVTLSPHKAGGLRGHGVLAGRSLQDRLRPLLRGGSQEAGIRPGTQSPALAAANALAIERAIAETEARAASMAHQRDAFLEALRQSGCNHIVLTPLPTSLPNTVMLCLPDIDGRNLLPALDLEGVHASHGSACSSGSPTPPRILRAIGLDDQQARASVRFSFGYDGDVSDAREAGERVAHVAHRMRQKK